MTRHRTAGLTRRDVLAAAAGGAALAATGGLATTGLSARGTSAAAAGLPSPSTSGLDHIVFVCMENRSFDHFLGWLPGADGKQAGLTYLDNQGRPHSTHHLTSDNGCGSADPDHSYAGGRVQYDNGRLDGFRKGTNDDLAIGYYTAADLPFYAGAVTEGTVFDRYFCSILGPTYPNRFYTHAAYTDRLDNYTRFATVPTIWDRLADAGVPARYYFSDVPFLALWGQQYLPISSRIETFFAQAASGTLPAFSYLDPSFTGEDQGLSNDDHPHADIRRGQAFLSRIATALVNSPLWSRTALVITYDEWGGFFDHVPPPLLPDDHDVNPGPEHGRAGFRVPALVLSPFARKGYVGHNTYDHTSMLRMVEWRFGLRPLTRRDANARNLAETFDFAAPRRTKPAIPLVPEPPVPLTCPPSPVGESSEWAELQAIAQRLGFP